MEEAPIYNNEDERLKVVHELGILDTPNEGPFDILTLEACEKLQMPISTISIIDHNREWFKSRQGMNLQQGPRNVSFCGHAMYADYIFIVEDTLLDERFKDNPYVKGSPFVRFYAGVSLRDYKTKLPIGVLCVKDIKTRKMNQVEVGILLELAAKAEEELNVGKNI
jgi:GAF domain-containing protein